MLDFTYTNIADGEMRTIISLMTSALFKVEKYKVIDISQREAILDEIEFSTSDCTDQSYQLEVGRMLSAEQIIVGDLGKVGDRYIITARILKVENGITLSSSDNIYSGLNALVDGIYDFVAKLTNIEFSGVGGVSPILSTLSRVAEKKTYGDLEITVKTAGSFYLDDSKRGRITTGEILEIPGVEVGPYIVRMNYDDGETETEIIHVSKDTKTVVSFDYIADGHLKVKVINKTGESVYVHFGYLILVSENRAVRWTGTEEGLTMNKEEVKIFYTTELPPEIYYWHIAAKYIVYLGPQSFPSYKNYFEANTDHFSLASGESKEIVVTLHKIKSGILKKKIEFDFSIRRSN